MNQVVYMVKECGNDLNCKIVHCYCISSKISSLFSSMEYFFSRCGTKCSTLVTKECVLVVKFKLVHSTVFLMKGWGVGSEHKTKATWGIRLYLDDFFVVEREMLPCCTEDILLQTIWSCQCRN